MTRTKERYLMRLVRAAGLVAILAVVATACEGGGDGATARRSADISRVVLISFDACDDLLQHLRAEGAERVGPWGLPGEGGPISVMPVAGAEVAADDASAFGADGATASRAESAQATGGTGGDNGTTFSGTNVQEEGVDEPDIVKTDGQRLVTVSGNTLHVVDVTGEVRRTGSVELPSSWGHELLIHGDRALVLSNGAGEGEGGVPSPEPVLREEIGIAPAGTPKALLSEVDLADAAAPRVVSTLEVEGAYVSARLVDGTARVVLRSSASLPFVHPTGGEGSEDVADRANRRIVADSELEDWMPTFRLERDGELADEGALLDCSDVSRPSVFSGFGTLTVLTVPLDEPLGPGEGTAVLAGGETVYASARTLYVATHQWPEELPQPDPAGADIAVDPTEPGSTDIHSFDIAADGPAAYLASGSVEGQLLNQFSMSEHEGRLRVATTEGAPWGPRAEDSESSVVVLERDGSRLAEIGRVGGLGRTETIHAVRFIGDLGYVVTFRRTDPLYVVDLTDPTSPRVAGELKIPGYSAYLHPVGDGLLLGVGQDATEEGQVTGSQVSLFDVSDPAAPTRLHQLDLGPGSSEVEWDHRAFLWWAPSSLAVLPIQRHDVVGIPIPVEEGEAAASSVEEGDDPVSDDDSGAGQSEPGSPGIEPDRTEPGGGGTEPAPPSSPPSSDFRAPFIGAVGISVGRDPGLGTVGELSHSAHVADPWQGMIRRSVVIGDRLFTLSEQGILVSDLASLAEIGWVALAA